MPTNVTDEWWDRWTAMEVIPRTPSQRIVCAVLKDLSGRAGIKHMLSEVDEYVVPELLRELIGVVEALDTLEKYDELARAALALFQVVSDLLPFTTLEEVLSSALAERTWNGGMAQTLTRKAVEDLRAALHRGAA